MSPYYPSDVDYYEYISSPEWRAKADAAKKRVGYRCAVNAEHSVANGYKLNAHHRTYERLGHERDDDILVLCRECHELYEKNRMLPEPPQRRQENRSYNAIGKTIVRRQPTSPAWQTSRFGTNNRAALSVIGVLLVIVVIVVMSLIGEPPDGEDGLPTLTQPNQTSVKPTQKPTRDTRNCVGGCTEKPTWCERPIKGIRRRAPGQPLAKFYLEHEHQGYAKVIIVLSRGERWFCTKQEAYDAGWKRPFQ